MPDVESANRISYYRCNCGCDALVLRLHHEDGEVFAMAEFSADEARLLSRQLGEMFPSDEIGEVAGNA